MAQTETSDSDPSTCFGTTKLDQMSIFGDDPYTRDAAHEGADFSEVGDQKGMGSGLKYHVIHIVVRY